MFGEYINKCINIIAFLFFLWSLSFSMDVSTLTKWCWGSNIFRWTHSSLVAQTVKNLPAVQETWFISWVGKIAWRRDRLPTPVLLGFLICVQCRRPVFSPWVGKIPWRRAWQPTPVFLPGEFQRGSWKAAVHRLAKSQIGLSDFHLLYSQESLSSRIRKTHVGTEPDITKRSFKPWSIC